MSQSEQTALSEYAARVKKCYVELETVIFTSPRRNRVARKVNLWRLYLPAPSKPVVCQSFDDACSVAADFDCAVFL